MKNFHIVLWLAVALLAGWLLYHRSAANHGDDCQAYDRFGNGIGCEGPDLADRL